MKIQELNISARARMCLLSAGYEEIEELKDTTDEELLKIRNLNAKGVLEIREKIEEYFDEEEFIDFDDYYENEFEDISIFQSDERIGVIIEFCGIEFDTGSETITINIWVKSKSEDTYNIWIKDLYINGKQHEGYSKIGEISNYDSSYMEEVIDESADINYEKIRTIRFLVEIDDESNNELVNSKIVTVSCDTENESFSVESIEDYEDEIDDGNTYDLKDLSTDELLGRTIDELELNVRSYNLLRKAGIYTIGDLCEKTIDDIIKIRSLGRKSLEEIVDKLEQAGLSLKGQDNSYYFMSLYPASIQKIAREKDEYWEYRLFIEVAIYKYESLQEYRNQRIEFWKDEGCLNRIEENNEFTEFIEAQLNRLLRFVQEFADTMNKDAKDAWGKTGEVGDAHKIIKVTEKLMQIYKDMITWKLSFGNINAEQIYRRVLEQFCLLIDSVLDNIDVLYSKLQVARKQFEDLLSGLIIEENLQVDLSVTFKAKIDDFSKEWNEWRRKYYDESH